MEEGLVSNLFKQFARKSNLNPLFLYEMTIAEVMVYFEHIGKREREELETELHIIRLGVNSALSGKNVELFKDSKPKMNRISKAEREAELLALQDL